jgi:hypothetical protein
MERLPDGRVQFYRPDGVAMQAVPTPHPLSDDPTADLRAENEGSGIEIDSKTIVPDWWGHPLNIDEVMSIIYEPKKPQDLNSSFRFCR